MKTLNEYIKESLLDDEDVLIGNVKNSVKWFNIIKQQLVKYAESRGSLTTYGEIYDYIENNMSERLVELLETNQSDTVICSMVIQKEEGKSFKDIMPGIFSGDDVAKNLIKIYKTNYIVVLVVVSVDMWISFSNP